ncbi:MAG: hypothetical protein LBR40_06415, partial [Bacilli bacterium]|nr:hypothetical protein [Bacilli bacterium]
MKVNDEQILYYMANAYEMNNSIIDSINALKNFNIISDDKYNLIIKNIKQEASLENILLILIKNKMLINYILFFNNYHSLNKSFKISIDIITIIKNIKKEIINAMIYPFILIIFTCIALLFVSNYLVPQLVMINPEAINNYRIIIKLLNSIPIILLIIILLFFSLVLTFILLFRKDFNKTLDILLRIPLLNKLLIIYITLKFALQFKDIIKNTTISKNAFEILSKQSNDLFIQYLTNYLQTNLNNGNSFNSIIKQTPLLLEEFKQQIYLCTNSSSMAITIENYFNFKVNIIKNKIKRIISIAVPIIISII